MPNFIKRVEGNPELVKRGIHCDEWKYDYEKLATELTEYKRIGMMKEYYQTMRDMSKVDLFFFCYFVLDLPVNDPFVLARIYEAQDNGWHMTLNLWAREHFKSTVLTYALPLWIVINKPESRVCIFSFTRGLAKSHLRRIKHTMESKEVLWKAFPEIFYNNPKGQAPKWSEDDGLYVKRKGMFGEATFEAAGLIDGMPTGKHYTDRVYDDVITERSVATPSQIVKATEMFKLSDFLGTRKGAKWVIGTKYSHKDTYSDLARMKVWIKRLFPAEIDGTKEETVGMIGGIPVMFDAEELKSKHEQQGDFIYSSQMLQNPTVASDMKFQLTWLEYYTKLPTALNKYILVDPAGNKTKSADYTVIIVIGVDSLRNYYLVDIIRDKLNLGDKWTKLVETVQKHGIQEIHYEKYGMQADIEYFNERMSATGVYFHIEPFAGTGSKHSRIMGLVPLFQQHRIRIPRAFPYLAMDGEYKDLILELVEEYEYYPYSGGHDDILDIMGRLFDSTVSVTFPTTQSEEQQKDPVYNPLRFKKSGNTTWQSVV
jgi:predicted phage terminase large subunit-like protein